MIDWTKHIVAGAVGIVDRMAQDWDVNVVPPRTEAFKTATDLGRLGIVLVGLGLQAYQPRYTVYGEGMSVGGTPLLVQSVWKAIAGAGAGKRVTYTPQRRSTPQPQGAAQRYPAPSYQRQFRNVQLE